MRTIKMDRHQKFAGEHGMSSHFVSARTGDSVSTLNACGMYVALCLVCVCVCVCVFMCACTGRRATYVWACVIKSKLLSMYIETTLVSMLFKKRKYIITVVFSWTWKAKRILYKDKRKEIFIWRFCGFKEFHTWRNSVRYRNLDWYYFILDNRISIQMGL